MDSNDINDSLTNTWWPSSAKQEKQQQEEEEQFVVVNFTINWPPNFSVTGSQEMCIWKEKSYEQRARDSNQPN